MQSLQLRGVQFLSRPFSREDYVVPNASLTTKEGRKLDGYMKFEFGAPLLVGAAPNTKMRPNYAHPWEPQEDCPSIGAVQWIDPYAELRWPSYALVSFNAGVEGTALDTPAQCDILQRMRTLVCFHIFDLTELKALTDQILSQDGYRYGYWTPGLDFVRNPVPAPGKYHNADRGEPIGRPAMIPILVKAGANPNKRYIYEKNTLLILAIEKDRKGFDNAVYVKALINNGVDVNLKNDKGASPLHAARKKNDPKVIELLEKAARDGYRKAWESIEAENPQLWNEFKSNDVDAMIDELVKYKKVNFPDDQRRILVCGFVKDKVHVEWLPPVAPGVDSAWEMRLHGLVRTGNPKEAIRFLQETRSLSRTQAEEIVALVASKLEIK